MTFPFLLFRFIRYAGRLSLSRSQSCRSNSAEHPFSTAALGIGQVVWEKQGEAAGASQDSGVCSVHMSAWFLRLDREGVRTFRGSPLPLPPLQRAYTARC